VFAHLADGDGAALPARGARVEADSGLQIDLDREQRLGQADDVVLAARSVRVFAGNAEGGLLAFAETLQRALQRRQDLAPAVQIPDGVVAHARLHDPAVAQAHQVLQRDHAAALDAHVTSDEENLGMRRSAGNRVEAADQAGCGAPGRASRRAAAAAASAAPRPSAAAGETRSQRAPAISDAASRPAPETRL